MSKFIKNSLVNILILACILSLTGCSKSTSEISPAYDKGYADGVSQSKKDPISYKFSADYKEGYDTGLEDAESPLDQYYDE